MHGMKDPARGEIRLHVPLGGIGKDSMDAALGILPKWLTDILNTDPDSYKILDSGGILTIEHLNADGALVANRSVQQWLTALGAPQLFVQYEWQPGMQYIGGEETWCNGKRIWEADHDSDGNATLNIRDIEQLIKDGKDLQAARDLLAGPPCPYDVGDLHVELEVE